MTALSTTPPPLQTSPSSTLPPSPSRSPIPASSSAGTSDPEDAFLQKADVIPSSVFVKATIALTSMEDATSLVTPSAVALQPEDRSQLQSIIRVVAMRLTPALKEKITKLEGNVADYSQSQFIRQNVIRALTHQDKPPCSLKNT